MNPADATKALNDLTADFEKNAAALRAIIEAPEKAGRWEPKEEDVYWFVNDYGDLVTSQFNDHCRHAYRLSVGNVHRTEAEAETYKLWLESFVPVYGLTVPDVETLRKGWLSFIWDSGEVEVSRVKSDDDDHYMFACYLDSTWHPTREAAEAWLERFGKVRGFRK